MLILRRFRLRRSKMLSLLDELELVGGKARSLYIPPALPLPQVANLTQELSEDETVPSDLAEMASCSKTAAILFWGPYRKLLVSPPFPVMEKHLSKKYDVGPFRSLLQSDFKLALVMVRLGAYAIGVYQGEGFLNGKVGTGLIHARHKKGGSSQSRFGRRRENQIEHFLDRVCEHVGAQLGPHLRELNYIVYGGSRTAIISLQKRCPLLSQFDNRTLPPLFDIPKPDRAALEAGINQVWSSSVTEWYESGRVF